MYNYEPASVPKTPGQEDTYDAVLLLRHKAAKEPTTRADALQLRRLAKEFDQWVAKVSARYVAVPEPAAVADLRAELAAKQRQALSAIAGRFFKFVDNNWKQSSVLFVAIFSLVGYVYSYFLFDQFDISINPYLQGIEDLVLIGVLKGAWPLFILLLLSIWILSIHHAAQSAGCKQAGIAGAGSAATRWVSLVILANSPAAIASAIGLAAILIFAGIAQAAYEAATASSQGTLLVRLDANDKPIRVERLLGSTTSYLFVQLPSSGDGENGHSMALARSIVRCIGPHPRSATQPVQDSDPVQDSYGVPPCDVVRAKMTPGLDPAPCPACKALEQRTADTSKSGHKRAIAAQLGCEVEHSEPRFFETFDFRDDSDALFEAKDVARDCGRSVRPNDCARRKLDDFLASAHSDTPERRVFILGFASQKHLASYNLDLSERRAAFVHRLASTWPGQPLSFGLGESPWMKALQSPTSRVALVVVCQPAPLHGPSVPPSEVVVRSTPSSSIPILALQ